jgi:hypothetical protein
MDELTRKGIRVAVTALHAHAVLGAALPGDPTSFAAGSRKQPTGGRFHTIALIVHYRDFLKTSPLFFTEAD